MLLVLGIAIQLQFVPLVPIVKEYFGMYIQDCLNFEATGLFALVFNKVSSMHFL